MNRRRVAGHAAERGPTATTSGSPAAFHTLLSQQRHELGIPVAEALRCRRVRSADRKSECDFARSLPALPAIRDADAPDTCAGAHGDREAILLASGRLDRRANFGVGLPICVVSNEHLGGDVPDELAEDVGARAEDIDALFVRQRGRVRGHALRGDGRRGVHGDSVAAHPLVRAEGVRLVLVPAAALVLAAALSFSLVEASLALALVFSALAALAGILAAARPGRRPRRLAIDPLALKVVVPVVGSHEVDRTCVGEGHKAKTSEAAFLVVLQVHPGDGAEGHEVLGQGLLGHALRQAAHKELAGVVALASASLALVLASLAEASASLAEASEVVVFLSLAALAEVAAL
mmetsp:Transcript_56224/g.142487  ORF Transcript_56224/g.142487 Transcript_56224/m.142487 type:complete len:348 (-) Transcript_56224:386-1429(-)